MFKELLVTVGLAAVAAAAGAQEETRAQRNQASTASELQEVVVTAQKRAERLQDVPISIGVLGGSDLEKSGARGIGDQLNQVGGVSLIENQPGRSQIAIRGASAGGPYGTGSSPVGYYLDEVPFSFITHAIVPDANAFDLARVEVLKGPQGTLYGASSLNGVVRILTHDADLNEFEMKGRARFGSTQNSEDLYGGDLAVNVPLVPGKLAIRAVASYADQGGFISTASKKDFNDDTSQSYRIKINAAPLDNLSIALSAWASRIDNGGPSEGTDNLTTPFSTNQAYRYDYETYNLVLNYDVGPFSLLSSTGYIDLTTDGAFDYLNVVPFGPPTVNQHNEHDSKVFSQEVRFTSNFRGPWQLTGGVLYRTIDELLDQHPEFFPFTATNVNKSESYAVFAEVTRSLLDGKVKLTGGVRYFEDTEKSRQQSSPFTGTALLAPPVQSDFDALTWRAVASYYPADDLTLYVSAATGFRSGLNQDFTAMAFDPTLRPVEADKLLSYEIGAKGSAAAGRFSYEIAAYHEKWDDPQQLLFNPIGTTFLVNAASASGFGLSASVMARITDRFSVNASGDWNNLEFDKDVFQQAAIMFPKGGRMNTSPETTASLGAEYRQPVGGERHVFVAGSARYSSKLVRHDVVGGVSATSESDSILYGELRAGLETRSWTGSLFVDNVTNERGAAAPAVSIIPTQLRLRPRTVGLQVSFAY